MIDDDINALSELWIKADPGPDLSELKAAITKAVRRDRLIVVVEYAVAASVGLAILAVMVSLPEPRILAVGVLLLLGLGATIIYIRHLQRMTKTPAQGDVRALFTAHTERIRARIKRYKVGLYAFMPAAFLGSLLGHFIADDGARAETIRSGLGWLAGWPLLGLGVLTFVLVGGLSFMLLQREKARLAHSEDLLANLASDE